VIISHQLSEEADDGGSMKQARPAYVSRLWQWREGKGRTPDGASGVPVLSPIYLSGAKRGTRRLRANAKVEMSRRLRVKVGDLFDIEPLVKEVVA
jgi:hypothetical protein